MERINQQYEVRALFITGGHIDAEIKELHKIYEAYDGQWSLKSNPEFIFCGKLEMKKDDELIKYGYVMHDGKEYKAEDLDCISMTLDSESIPKWFGLPMPKTVLYWELMSRMLRFEQTMMRMNYLTDGLARMGFNDDQIIAVKKGELIIKDIDELEKMEARMLTPDKHQGSKDYIN